MCDERPAPDLPRRAGFEFCIDSKAPPDGSRSSRLLASLPAPDRQRLQSQLLRVELSRGQRLIDAGCVPNHVYFPITATVSLQSTMSSGRSGEVAVVGNEGMVGLPVLMGGGSTLSDAVVRTPGQALRVSRNSIKAEFDRGGPLMQVLLRYTQALMTHMAQTVTCSQHHSIEQRLCRCLLDSLDRTPAADDLLMTQESISLWLGVRRESVTMSTLKLQHAGVIRNGRGRISVLSRSLLEARSCECYAVVRKEYDRLLPDADSAEVDEPWMGCLEHRVERRTMVDRAARAVPA